MGNLATSGAETVSQLGGVDLTGDGKVINLAIIGSSRCYDFSLVEGEIDDWASKFGFPDLVLLGGASGVDYLAERWADNNNVPIAVFHEEWVRPRSGLIDGGRPEAPNSLTEKIIESATHILAFPSSTSKWTRITIDLARKRGVGVTVKELENDIAA